jgi:superfamily II DNA or RNA helicase
MLEFLSYIDKIQMNIMVIGDEIHHLGSNKLKIGLSEKYQYRIGLSATPSRWFDEHGSSILQNYFNGVCYSFPLKDAIGKHLVNYHYYPLISRLNEEELSKYDELTDKINKLSVSKSKNKEDFEDLLLNLNIKRSAILSNAESKLPKLLEILNNLKQSNQKQGKELKNVLVYCAPGGHKEVLKAISELGLRCHEFVHSVTAKRRQEIIGEFIEGNIQVLVAIKCLDEGVDIPSIKTAFILASTTNPMEFIQRRGRILRKSPNKHEAEIYDFVAMPGKGNIEERHKSILKREMPRVVEFSSLAINQYSSKQEITNMLFENEMMELANKTSWDIFIETKKEL